jgi:F0F1-type ATP synthase alpha subunit
VDQSTETEVLETGIKVIDLICPILKGGKVADRAERIIGGKIKKKARVSFPDALLKEAISGEKIRQAFK